MKNMVNLDICQETITVRDCTDKNSMPVLDGFHMDKRGHDMLPAVARFQQADLRSRGLHMHARLGKYGRLYNHPINTRTRSFGHNNRVHVFLHILDDATAEIRCTDTRQRVCDSLVRKSQQSKSHHVLRSRYGVLGILGTLRWAQNLL